jgi:hypothetical protein
MKIATGRGAGPLPPASGTASDHSGAVTTSAEGDANSAVSAATPPASGVAACAGAGAASKSSAASKSRAHARRGGSVERSILGVRGGGGRGRAVSGPCGGPWPPPAADRAGGRSARARRSSRARPRAAAQPCRRVQGRLWRHSVPGAGARAPGAAARGARPRGASSRRGTGAAAGGARRGHAGPTQAFAVAEVRTDPWAARGGRARGVGWETRVLAACRPRTSAPPNPHPEEDTARLSLRWRLRRGLARGRSLAGNPRTRAWGGGALLTQLVIIRRLQRRAPFQRRSPLGVRRGGGVGGRRARRVLCRAAGAGVCRGRGAGVCRGRGAGPAGPPSGARPRGAGDRGWRARSARRAVLAGVIP